jgi:hypothetical protein
MPKADTAFAMIVVFLGVLREADQHDLGFTIKVKGVGVVYFIVLDHPHEIGTETEHGTKKFSLSSAVLKRTYASPRG